MGAGQVAVSGGNARERREADGWGRVREGKGKGGGDAIGKGTWKARQVEGRKKGVGNEGLRAGGWRKDIRKKMGRTEDI